MDERLLYRYERLGFRFVSLMHVRIVILLVVVLRKPWRRVVGLAGVQDREFTLVPNCKGRTYIITGRPHILHGRTTTLPGRMLLTCRAEMVLGIVDEDKVYIAQLLIVPQSCLPDVFILDVHHCELCLPNEGDSIEDVCVPIGVFLHHVSETTNSKVWTLLKNIT